MGPTDLNLYRAFAAVVETGSYTRAAERLQCPKSWVSRAVTTLEDELGVRLLHRTTRSISLSTAGTTLYERVKGPLAELGTSGAELTEHAGEPAGTLRITSTVDFGATLLAGVIARFSVAYPAVRVDLRLTNATVDIVGEGYDAALRFTSKPMRDSSLYAKKLIAFDMGIYASADYIARKGVPTSAKHLTDHDWVQFRPLPPEILFEQGEESIKVNTAGRIQCDDMMAVHALMMAGAGLALLPEFVTDADISAKRAKRVLPELGRRSGHLWFVAPSAKHLPTKVVAFRDFLKEALEKCPGPGQGVSAGKPQR